VSAYVPMGNTLGCCSGDRGDDVHINIGLLGGHTRTSSSGGGRDDVRAFVRQLKSARAPALRLMETWWLATHADSGADKWASTAAQTSGYAAHSSWLNSVYGQLLRGGERVPVGESLLLVQEDGRVLVLTMVRLSFTMTADVAAALAYTKGDGSTYVGKGCLPSNYGNLVDVLGLESALISMDALAFVGKDTPEGPVDFSAMEAAFESMDVALGTVVNREVGLKALEDGLRELDLGEIEDVQPPEAITK